MHELSIAENLASIILEVAGKENLSKVTRVNVSIGEMSQVVPELLESAFQITVKGTVADEAKLEMEIIPLRIRCSDCGSEIVMKEMVFSCTNCGSLNVEIVSGNELFVKSIEGE